MRDQPPSGGKPRVSADASEALGRKYGTNAARRPISGTGSGDVRGWLETALFDGSDAPSTFGEWLYWAAYGTRDSSDDVSEILAQLLKDGRNSAVLWGTLGAVGDGGAAAIISSEVGGVGALPAAVSGGLSGAAVGFLKGIQTGALRYLALKLFALMEEPNEAQSLFGQSTLPARYVATLRRLRVRAREAGMAVNPQWWDPTQPPFIDLPGSSGKQRAGGLSRAFGGPVTGPGSGTSDSIAALLSDGEWVIRAGAVEALGDSALRMLNQWDRLSSDQRAGVAAALSEGSALSFSSGGLGSVSRGIAGDAATNETRYEELADQIDAVSQALDQAQSRLQAAQEAFDSFNESVAAGIRLGNEFSDAVGAQSKAQDAVTDAVKKQTDAQKQLAIAKASGTDAQVASATRALAEADQAVAAAKAADGGFLSFLQKGAGTAATFSAQIDALRATGASSDVVQRVAQLGAASGGSAAAELLAGGASAVGQANELVARVLELSKQTGQGAAKQYFGPAVDSAQSQYNSISAQMAALQQALNDIPRNAEGGVVTRATLAVVGEAGPEAIIPLNRAGALGSGSAVSVSLTVQGSVVQESDLVVSVRDGIAQLMRRRGLDPSIIGV